MRKYEIIFIAQPDLDEENLNSVIEKINADNLAAGIKEVMGSDKINVAEPQQKTATVAGKEKTFIVYDVTDESGAKLGKAVQTSENGFGGELQVLVGFDQEGTILGYTILQHAETPGLGAKADNWFQKGQKGDIIGKTPAEPLTVSKDGGQVDAITASTITSRAFLLAVNNAYNAYVGALNTDAETGASKQVKN